MDEKGTHPTYLESPFDLNGVQVGSIAGFTQLLDSKLPGIVGQGLNFLISFLPT